MIQQGFQKFYEKEWIPVQQTLRCRLLGKHPETKVLLPTSGRAELGAMDLAEVDLAVADKIQNRELQR